MNDPERQQVWANARMVFEDQELKSLVLETLELYKTWLGTGRSGLKGLCFLNCQIVGQNLYGWLCEELVRLGLVSLWLDDEAGISLPLDRHLHTVLLDALMNSGQASPAVLRIQLGSDFGL